MKKKKGFSSFLKGFQFPKIVSEKAALRFKAHRMVQNNSKKNKYLKDGTGLFYKIKKFLNSASKTIFSGVVIP